MLNITTTYPGQTAGTNANYPNGQARNVTVSGDGLGTPWEQQLLNDILGFMNAIVDEAGITVSGAPDTALASDVLDGLKILLALPTNHLDGLRVTRDSTVLMTTLPGSARNFADTKNLRLTSSLQKQINTTWVSGAGGGLPDPLTIAADTWYRRFIVGKADGSGIDLAWDTSATAANFFADANAIAAGFTDSTLYRRYGWTLTNSSSQMDDHYNHEDDPRRYTWGVTVNSGLVSVLTGARTTILIAEAPPDSSALLNVQAGSVSAQNLLFTESEQADTAPTGTLWTMGTVAVSPLVSEIRGRWKLDGSSQFFGRSSSATTSVTITIDGWIDNGIIP